MGDDGPCEAAYGGVMGEKTEDEHGRSLANFGPLTRMNMQRRNHPKHAEKLSMPWDEHRVHFLVASELSFSELREKLRAIPWPEGWVFNDTSVSSHIAKKLVIFDVTAPVITVADGAYIRALLNLLK